MEARITAARSRWRTVGLRIAIEPEYVFHADHQLELSIGGELAVGGLGPTWVRTSGIGTPSHAFDTEGGLFGLDVGPRVRLGAFSGGIALVHRNIVQEAATTPDGAELSAMAASFLGVAVTLGVRF